jgi:translation initiation factor IF-2
MAKVRAYKIAEELGLERNELIRRAAEVGIELRSPMVSLDEEQIAELRRRLGARADASREEKRVGSSVIRRRKRIAPSAEPLEAGEQEPLAAAPSAPSRAGLEARREGELGEIEPMAPGLEGAGPAAAGIEVPLERTEAPELAPATEPERPAARGPIEPLGAPPLARSELAEPARPPTRRLVRRQAIQGIQLREQETLARMLRGNVQSQLERRRQIVEQQSRIQPRRRRGVPQAPPRKAAPGERKRTLRIEGPLTLQELSRRTGVKLQELFGRIEALIGAVDRAAPVDAETAALVASDLGFEVRTAEEPEPAAAARLREEDRVTQPRAPVVTVMGHVDHGKTSLLDTIRKTNVVAGEVGGITQHIGAYKVRTNGQEVTFLDTPGHEAFTQMRARGARVTDIAVLVVAADDGVMPQTIEAISHAKAARVPILVAINKVDLPDANPRRVKQGLLEHGLVPEELGGETICVEVSAKKGLNIERLLEMIGLQAEILELRARARGPAEGTVIEARLDKGRGPVATVLVRQGVLEPGDVAVAGTTEGRIRALLDERGEALKEAGPSTPVQLIGLCAVPQAGDELLVVAGEREAKAIVDSRLEETRRKAVAEVESLPMDAEQLFETLEGEKETELRLVLKADVHGTMEAIRDSLSKLSSERARLRVIHCGVGAITESDVNLAVASGATVVGFHVRPEPAARKAAELEGIEIRTYEIVYDVLEDLRKLLQGLLPPRVTEKLVAQAEVRKLFSIPRVGTVAGCYVSEGTFARPNPVRVVRDGVIVYKGRLGSLRRFKDDVREVQAGLECGMSVENFNDVKVGDTLESYVVEETPATL